MRAHIYSLLFTAISAFASAIYAEEDVPVNEAREMCRESQDDGKIVECLEKGIYDPCDDASGVHSSTTARCVFAHTEVANRRIQKAEKKIAAQLKKSGDKTGMKEFRNSQRKWRDYVKSYCEFAQHAVPEASPFGSIGMCERRHNEQRADELEQFLASEE